MKRRSRAVGSFGKPARGTEGHRHEGTKARRHEGTKGRRDEGTKGRRDEAVHGGFVWQVRAAAEKQTFFSGASAVGCGGCEFRSRKNRVQITIPFNRASRFHR